jgi:uncharacterized protein
MHPQLEILLQLQDLKAQRHELGLATDERLVEETEFHIDIDTALAEIDRKIEEMEGELDPRVQARYRRVAQRGRVVVPVIAGTCYGCFTSIPTSVASLTLGNDEIRSCENCGRFLYVAGP